jgi:hypothetical protein
VPHNATNDRQVNEILRNCLKTTLSETTFTARWRLNDHHLMIKDMYILIYRQAFVTLNTLMTEKLLFQREMVKNCLSSIA